jgi:hypothetical protein
MAFVLHNAVYDFSLKKSEGGTCRPISNPQRAMRSVSSFLFVLPLRSAPPVQKKSIHRTYHESSHCITDRGRFSVRFERITVVDHACNRSGCPYPTNHDRWFC